MNDVGILDAAFLRDVRAVSTCKNGRPMPEPVMVTAGISVRTGLQGTTQDSDLKPTGILSTC